MNNIYDIFISYKRKSLATANNLYYRLTTRGYATFFDLEEMGRDNFNVQLLNYIENATEVFVILEEGSLDACKQDDWEKDWFCHEIAFALEKKKNIIPILLNGYKMPSEDSFPYKLKELSLKNAPEFNFSFFEAYLDKLIEKKYLLSKPNLHEKASSVFKFYSNENCQVFKEGKLVCSLEGLSDEPYYLPVPRKGDYRFKGINPQNKESRLIKVHIEADEEKEIDIIWENNLSKEEDIIPKLRTTLDGRVKTKTKNEEGEIKNEHQKEELKNTYIVNGVMFEMVLVRGGTFIMGATPEQKRDAYKNEVPAHEVTLSEYYIGDTVVTQKLWQAVMGNNPSAFKDPDRPVVNVSWYDCQRFIENINKMLRDKLPIGKRFRLPTEAEWEFAARGGTRSKGYIYSGSDKLNDVGWYFGNCGEGQKVHFSFSKDRQNKPVKMKLHNELGIYDMSGNVWEWCQDWYGDYNGFAQNNPVGPASGYGRVCRGGGTGDGYGDCRSSNRSATSPSDSVSSIGLRLAL